MESDLRLVTTQLPPCDCVEIFHLNGFVYHPVESQSMMLLDEVTRKYVEVSRPEPGKGFSVRYRPGYEVKILGARTLYGSQAEALASLWRAQTFGDEFRTRCHTPGYGLRFFSGDALKFETTLCFACWNFYVPGSQGFFQWGFDIKSAKAGELLRQLQEIFPDSILRET